MQQGARVFFERVIAHCPVNVAVGEACSARCVTYVSGCGAPRRVMIGRRSDDRVVELRGAANPSRR